jgi:hypothetical protein
MQYVPVLGAAPSIATKTPVMHYFDYYLISIAEPTTSKRWTMQEIFKQVKKIQKLKLPGMKLYLDSGGFQIIIGHITENRIKEYTDVYHFILENFYKDIDYIFSLDINTPKFSKDKIFKYNDYSIDSSIELIKKYPEIADKQLFVVQSRFPHILQDWLELMDKHKVFLYYDRYSMGGLVCLKKETNVRFNHFVPMTIWLATYIQNRRKQDTPFPKQIKQIHMLGQSSRLALITGMILEKLFGIEVTMDSSEVIRFSPIEAKTPMVHKHETGYDIITNLKGMEEMIAAHSDPEAEQEVEAMKLELQSGRVSNQTFVELICQNLYNTIDFSKHLLEQHTAEEIVQWQEDDFREFHDVFKIGRLAKELANNMQMIRELKPYYDDNNFIGIHERVMQIIQNYYA